MRQENRRLLRDLDLDEETKVLVNGLWCSTVGDFLGVNLLARLESREWTQRQYQKMLTLQIELRNTTGQYRSTSAAKTSIFPRKALAKITSPEGSSLTVAKDDSARHILHTISTTEENDTVPLRRAFTKRVWRSLVRLGLKTRKQLSSLTLEGSELAGLDKDHRRQVWREVQTFLRRNDEQNSGYRGPWWYKSSETISGQKYVESRKAQPVYTEPKGVTNSAQRVDFTRPELCAQTRPLTCTIKGQVVVPSKQKWSHLLVSITELFIADCNPNLELLYTKPLRGNKVFFLPTKDDIGTCFLLSNGKWIYTNYNPRNIVMIIRNLCQHCCVDLDDVIITYEPKNGTSVPSGQTYLYPASAASAIQPKPVLDPALIEQLTTVLASHFANGFRLNSPIEMARFRAFAAKNLGEELTLTEKELRRYIAACGTIFDGKVYAVSAQAKERIKELAEDYFADGAQAIFFAEFYAKNENWLFEASVVSEDVLIDIFRSLFQKLSFTQTYFGYTGASVFATLKSEMLRVWGEDVLLSYSQLAARLRYISLERIKYALGNNGDFIWNSVETFSHVSRIDITDEEKDTIREAAEQECNLRGYASITSLPCGEIEERNNELSITAVHNAVYRVCLSDRFDRKGKIITRKGEVLDALTIMKENCSAIDKCSLDDLLNLEKELTGEGHRWIAMEAANSILVRIDKDTYVAEKYVYFNPDVIDEAIDLFVNGYYLPLVSFTTFAAFPDCGQPWNLFLLESYCRRFSRKFRFDALCVNSKNAGAVIRKSCRMDYKQIMIDAVANADVPLQDAAVGRFLCMSGYTGRNTNANVSEIIDKAKAIRESRV